MQKSVIGLYPENQQALEKFTELLKLKGYSPSTIRTYRNEFLQLLHLLKNKPVQMLTADDIKRYMVFAMEKQGIKENTAHSRINALKFYFEQVLERQKFFWEIPRPKKPMQLPKLLNEDELARLFNALTNKKHKAMLFTIYSAGLRVSELVNLKIADIDSVRMQIFVRRAKGKKDRYVNLSPVLLDILRSYIKDYKPKPKTYLFESEQTLTAYPTRTVQQIFSNAKNKAGVKKEIGIHSLRHSFATHLLDKGTDIRYIKDLLGHFNIKTTERYLHVSKKQLVNIISPLDDLWKKKSLDW
jgi:site-specific recombinase XerD